MSLTSSASSRRASSLSNLPSRTASLRRSQVRLEAKLFMPSLRLATTSSTVLTF